MKKKDVEKKIKKEVSKMKKQVKENIPKKIEKCECTNEKEFYICTKTFTFDSAHFLPEYVGKCGILHGHTWEIQISIYGEKLNDKKMLIDFNEIKFYVDQLQEMLDHKVLNDVIEEPTAENIAKYIYDYMSGKLKGNMCKVYSVVVKETPTNQVTYTKF